MFSEYSTHAGVHHVEETRRDGCGPGVRGRPVDRRAHQPLDLTRRLSYYEHGLNYTGLVL